MDARITKAEGSLLLPLLRNPAAERIDATRLAAIAAHDAALLAGLRRIVTRIADLLLAWPRRQRALAELNALTDRELADIGLTRGDFPRILAGQKTRPAAAPSRPALRKGAAFAA